MSDKRIKYQPFYLKQGIYRLSHLTKPILHNYNELVLPYNSVLHWVDTENEFDVGPSQTEPLIQRSADYTIVSTIAEYPIGNINSYITKKGMLSTLIPEYLNNNRSFRKMIHEPNSYSDNKTLLLFTYGLLDNNHVYRRTQTTNYEIWANYLYTVFDTAFKIAKLSDRQQFLELSIPKRYPTYANLKKGEQGISKENIQYLNNKDHWLIVAMWNLIAGNGNDFIFKSFTPTSPEFKKINIIWKIDDKYCIMNIGEFLSFAYKEKDSKLTPARLQRALINFFIRLTTSKEVDEELKETVDEQIDKFVNDNNDEEDQDNTTIRNNIVVPKAIKTNTNYLVENVDDIKLDDEIEEDENTPDEGIVKNLELMGDDDTEVISSYKPYKQTKVTDETVIQQEGQKLVKAGVMSVKEFERYNRLSHISYDLPNPNNPEQTISESLVVKPEDFKIKPVNPLPVQSNDIIDKSMLSSSMNAYTEEYVEKLMDKDILAMVMNIQKGGLVIKDYKVERVETINDKYNIHKVQIETLRGHTSTLVFKLPVVESDGTFVASGSRIRMRKQRIDLPIRKVDANSVALTSYYSKMFVNRSERKQFDLEGYIHNHIVSSSIEKLNGIREVKFGNVFNNEDKLPRIYTTIAKKISSFELGDDTLYFDNNSRHELFKFIPEQPGIIPLAVNTKTGNTSMYLDRNDPNGIVLDNNMKPIGTLEELINLDIANAPLEYAEVNIFGKIIPLVLILGHHIGFGNLLKTLKVEPRREPRNKRIHLSKDEYAIKFQDEVLIFNRKKNPTSNLVINGLLRFKNTLNHRSVYDLDNKSIYSDLFDEIKSPLRFLKESKDMFNLWVDPITERILNEMKEPTDLVLLFIRSAELLITDQHPEAMDISYMRDRGYERFSGMVYGEIIKAIREYNSKSLYNNTKLTINPESVWYSIVGDQSNTLCEESNPIHSMKEKEIIVFSGAGGRSGQTMTGASRKFDKSNIGITSEATVDSGDAGTIIYNTFDPNYTTVYGTTKKTEDVKSLGSAKIASTSFLLAPGAQNDDTKRAGFIAVQNSQTTFCTNYTPMPFRTGAEKVIHTRSTKMFSKIASKNGTVVDVTKDTMLVEYEDGTKEGFKLGRQFGVWGGYTIPHEIAPNVQKGQSFNAGQTLYYNSNFFQKDVTDNGNIIFKNFVLARVGFVENFSVFEDSAALSKEFSNKLLTRVSHVKNIRITTEQTIKNLVAIGSSVETDSILCTIHSAQLDTGLFSDETLASLETISQLNPKAGYKGTIDKINIIYTAEIEDMSEEMQDLVNEYNTRLYRESKKLNASIKNGKVDIGFMVDGVRLTSEDIVIQVYITETVDMSLADKIVVANQLKATVGSYWTEPQLSEDGQPIDVFFSANSIDKRIVLSPELMGSTNTLLVELTKRFIQEYDK